MLTVTKNHTETCFEAWIHCENLLVSLSNVRHKFSGKLVKVVDECASICMGTFHAIRSHSVNIRNFALLCVGICEECAELCEQHQGDAFRHCAETCRKCSVSISQLAF